MSTLFMTRDEVEPAKEGQELTYCDERGWHCEATGELARVKGFKEHALERAYSEEGSHASSLDPSPMQADKVNEPPPSPPFPCVEVTERAIADDPAHHWRIDPASPSKPLTPPEEVHVNRMTYPEDREPVYSVPVKVWNPETHAEEDVRVLSRSKMAEAMYHADHREPVQPLRPEDRLAMSATSVRALTRGLEVTTELLDHSDEPAQQLAILDRLVKLASALDRASTNSHVQGEDTAATVSGVSLSS